MKLVKTLLQCTDVSVLLLRYVDVGRSWRTENFHVTLT